MSAMSIHVLNPIFRFETLKMLINKSTHTKNNEYIKKMLFKNRRLFRMYFGMPTYKLDMYASFLKMKIPLDLISREMDESILGTIPEKIEMTGKISQHANTCYAAAVYTALFSVNDMMHDIILNVLKQKRDFKKAFFVNNILNNIMLPLRYGRTVPGNVITESIKFLSKYRINIKH